MSEIKKIKDRQDGILAYAAIPDKYLIGGELIDKMQHERVPFFITTYAIDPSRNVMIFALSDEMFTTYKNQIMKRAIKAVPNVITKSMVDFIEPEEYLQRSAENISQIKLTPVAQSNLPSIAGQNIQAAYKNMMTEYNNYFEIDARMGAPTYANNTIFTCPLVRYTGTNAQGVDTVVLAGMDYKGVEYYSPNDLTHMLSGLGNLFKKKKEEESSKQFGHGSPCDAIDWGSAYRFVLVTPAQYEEDATRDFLEFVATFHMEESLRQQFYQGIANRARMIRQQGQMLQRQAQQSMRNLQANQRRLAQTLAENSAAMSAGIMDSWNRKMASDSRISQARSEAIRGVNVYQNSYGQNVDVSVTADHVYQNSYGDVYGVSGNAIDDELLSRLNWKELKK